MLLANKHIKFTIKDDDNNDNADDDDDESLIISETINNPIAYTQLSDHVRKSIGDITILNSLSLFFCHPFSSKKFLLIPNWYMCKQKKTSPERF